jgi:hypothetical protein
MYGHDFFPKPLPHYAWLGFVVAPARRTSVACVASPAAFKDMLTELIENVSFHRFTETCCRNS